MSDNGLMGSMASTASQFADSQGGWGNVAKNAAGNYIESHGGAVGTAEHLGHEAFNTAANTLWGAKDWGDAARAAKAGDWGSAITSGLWGLASLGATASMVVPGVGEVVKGAELGAQAARAGVQAARAGEVAAKEIAEVGAKDVAETGAKEVAETGSKSAAKAEEGAVAKEESSLANKARKAEKWANRARHLPNLNWGGMQFNEGQAAQVPEVK